MSSPRAKQPARSLRNTAESVVGFRHIAWAVEPIPEAAQFKLVADPDYGAYEMEPSARGEKGEQVVITEACRQAAKTKDDLVDIINILIEEFVLMV
jgi:hypothetical protein